MSLIIDDMQLPQNPDYPDPSFMDLGMVDYPPLDLDAEYPMPVEQTPFQAGTSGRQGAVPSKGLDFNWDVLNVQTREEFDALSPGQQEILKMHKRGVVFNGHEAAQFLLKFESPEYQAQITKARQEAERAGFGQIPAGYMIQSDPQTGQKSLAMIPGGPAEAQKRASNEFTAVAAGTVVEDANRALTIVERSPRMATGKGQALFGKIPETEANALLQQIKSIQGNVGVDSLLKIKQSGAGLGAIPQAQLEMLSSLLGQLDPTMRAEDLKFNLERIRDIYTDIVEKASSEDKKLIEMSMTSPNEADGLLENFNAANNQAAQQQEQQAAEAQPLPPERTINGRTFRLNERGRYVPVN
jgi:hypothetical protein